MLIKVTHNGHEIKYHEESNVWRCDKMRLEDRSLAALRTKLNEEDRDDRRLADIHAVYLSHGEETVVVITLVETSRYSVMGYPVDGDKKRRESFSLSSLVLVNEKNESLLARHRETLKARDDAQAALTTARAALPHPTIEQLQKMSAKAKPSKKAKAS